MESIEIDGFLTIDHAYLEIKKINILIGAQAQGKSVIAKLVYFFKNFFTEIFIPSIRNLETKRDINKKTLSQFKKIFPRYAWVNQEFTITYSDENYQISIIRTKAANNKYTLKFSYCNELATYHRKIKTCYKQALAKADELIDEHEKHQILNAIINDKLSESDLKKLFITTIFIPASRSFFANLQKNIFSFLASNIDIDPLIKEFGFRYEQSKRFHDTGLLLHRELDENTEKTHSKIAQLVKDIVVGEYIYADEQDWISNNGKRTNLANASSGQQESLPMLLILKIWPFIYGKRQSSTFFIEEPEAHLFPVSQKQIISLIATLYHVMGHTFFITTHSPYILTAINNLVVGQDAYHKAHNNVDKLAELEKVLAADELIALEDVSAYTLNKGKLESIIDMENRLIGANLLDAVSDEFDTAFGVATDILYGDD